jgi:hypothetical protein
VTQPEEGTAATTVVGTGEGAPKWATFATKDFIVSLKQKKA